MATYHQSKNAKKHQKSQRDYLVSIFKDPSICIFDIEDETSGPRGHKVTVTFCKHLDTDVIIHEK